MNLTEERANYETYRRHLAGECCGGKAMTDDHEARLRDAVFAAVRMMGMLTAEEAASIDLGEGPSPVVVKQRRTAGINNALDRLLRYTAAKARGGMPCYRSGNMEPDERCRGYTPEVGGNPYQPCPACQARADLAAILKEIEHE